METVLFVLVVVFGIMVLKSSIVIVPQQSIYVVERIGKYSESLDAGLSFLIPFVDRVAYRHSLKEVPYDVAPQVCITRDNSQVQIDGILYYQVTDARMASYGTSNFEMAIEQLAKTTLRSEVGKRELDRLLDGLGLVARLLVLVVGQGVRDGAAARLDVCDAVLDHDRTNVDAGVEVA